MTKENDVLVTDIEHLKQQLSKNQQTNHSHSEMKRTLRILEEQVDQERQCFQQQVKVLQSRNQQLLNQVRFPYTDIIGLQMIRTFDNTLERPGISD